MGKKAIPASRVRSDIDDFLAYHYSPERDRLSDRGLLNSFIDKWESDFFFTLQRIKKSKSQEDEMLSEDEKNTKYTHLAMRIILEEIREDIDL